MTWKSHFRCQCVFASSNLVAAIQRRCRESQLSEIIFIFFWLAADARGKKSFTAASNSSAVENSHEFQRRANKRNQQAKQSRTITIFAREMCQYRLLVACWQYKEGSCAEVAGGMLSWLKICSIDRIRWVPHSVVSVSTCFKFFITHANNNRRRSRHAGTFFHFGTSNVHCGATPPRINCVKRIQHEN